MANEKAIIVEFKAEGEDATFKAIYKPWNESVEVSQNLTECSRDIFGYGKWSIEQKYIHSFKRMTNKVTLCEKVCYFADKALAAAIN